MKIPLSDLQRFVRLCDPSQPLQNDDPRYVSLDEGTPVRGSDQPSAIDVLRDTILLSESSESCQLFTGFPGSGKTTELHRLEARLRQAEDLPTYPIYVDFEEYLNRYTPVSITDVLRVLAYCLDREATLAEGNDPDKRPGYLKRLYDFVAQHDVEIKNLGFQSYGASLMLEIRNNPIFRKRLEETLALRFQSFADEATQFMSQAVVRLREAKSSTAHRVVVICDGLEKLAAMREEDQSEMEKSVERLYLEHSIHLHIPCHVIYTFPLWLRFRSAGLGGVFDQEPLILPMVKVTHQDGSPYEPGIAKLIEIVSRRLDVQKVFGADLGASLRQIVLSSGGYPRDLLRLVRGLLSPSKSYPVVAADAERVIERLAEDYAMTIRSTHLDTLAEVARTHQIPMGDTTRIADFGQLIERWLVLCYRNGREWFDLHPLVRRSTALQAHMARPQT